MGIDFNSYGGGTLPPGTATAGTAWTQVIPPSVQGFTRICQVNISCGNTANKVYFQRPIFPAIKTTAASAVNTNTLTLASIPNPNASNLAASDYLIVQQYLVTGAVNTPIYGAYSVSAFNTTTLVVTINGNFAYPVALGALVWDCGQTTYTDPWVGQAVPYILPIVNTNNALTTFTAAGVKGWNAGDPILVYCPNATAQTNLNFLEYVHTIT